MDTKMMPRIFLCLLLVVGGQGFSGTDRAESAEDTDAAHSYLHRSKRQFITSSLLGLIGARVIAGMNTDEIPAYISSNDISTILSVTSFLNETQRVRVLNSLSGEGVMNLTNRMTQEQRAQLLRYIPPEGVMGLANKLTSEQLGDLLESLPGDSVFNLTRTLSSEQNLQIIQKLSPDTVLKLISNLTDEQAVDVLKSLLPEGISNLTKTFTSAQLTELISSLPADGVGSIVSSLPTDGVVALVRKLTADTDVSLPQDVLAGVLQALPADVIADILQELTPEQKAKLVEPFLLQIPQGEQTTSSAPPSTPDTNTLGAPQETSSPKTALTGTPTVSSTTAAQTGTPITQAASTSNDTYTNTPTPPKTTSTTNAAGAHPVGATQSTSTTTTLQTNRPATTPSTSSSRATPTGTQKPQVGLLALLAGMNPSQIAVLIKGLPVASILPQLDTQTLVGLVSLLPSETTVDLVMTLPPQVTGQLLGKLPEDLIANLTGLLNTTQKVALLSSLASADVVKIATALPAEEVGNVLLQLDSSVLVNITKALNATQLQTLLGVLPPASVPHLATTLLASLAPDDVLRLMSVWSPNVTSFLLRSLDNRTIVGMVQKLSPSQTVTLLSLLQQSDIQSVLSAVPVDIVLSLLANATGPEVKSLLQVVPKDVVSGIVTSLPEDKLVSLTQTFPPDNLAYLLLSLSPTQVSDLLDKVPQDVTLGLISKLPSQLLANFTAVLPVDQLTKLLNSLSQNQTTSLIQMFPPDALSVLIHKLPHEVLLNLTMSLSQDALVAILNKLPAPQLQALLSSFDSDTLDDLVKKIPVEEVFKLTRVLDTQFLMNLKLGTVLGVLTANPDNLVRLINELSPDGIFGLLNSGLIKPVLQGLLGSVTPQQLEGLLGMFPPNKLQGMVSALVPDLLTQMTQGEGGMDLSAVLSPEVIQVLTSNVPFSDLLGVLGPLIPQLPLMLAGSVSALIESPTINSTSLDQCLSDIQLFLVDLSNGTQWAVDMFDAFGKPGRGIQKGNTHMHGNYDQCLEVTHAILNGSSVSREIKGSYCGIELGLPPGLLPPVPAQGILPDVVVELYACLPNTCFQEDLQQLLSSLKLPMNLTVPRVSCQQDEDVSGDVRAIAAICVLAFLGLLTVIGTAFDIFHTKEDRSDRFTIADHSNVNGGFEMQENSTVEVGEEAITSFSATRNGGSGYMPHEEEDSDESDDEDEQGSKLSRVLLAFSLSRNTDRLLNVDNTPDSVTCLHGIRVLSIGWLIVGYTLYVMATYFENALGAAEALEGIVGQVVIHSTLAVDSFLVISGFLTAFLFVGEAIDKEEVKAKNILFYFIHRFIRLTPAYAITIMALTCILPYLSDGPNWTRESREYYSSCKTYWWTNLLYINNFYKSLKDQCMPWSWYLSMDMQFHWLVAPLIIIPLAAGTVSGSKWIRALPTILIGGLVAMQIVLTIYFEENIDGDFLRNRDAFHWEIYEKPYTRVAPYALGLGFGYAVALVRGHHPISKAAATAAWLFSLAIIFAATFVKINENHVMMDEPFHWSHGVRAAHEAIYRPAFSFALCVIIFLCATGNGGFINSILSWRGFLPFSRLTYGIFLLHPAVILADQWQARIPVYFHLSYVAQRAAGYFVITAIFAYVLLVTVETPIAAIERIIFKRKRIAPVTAL